MLKHLPQLMKFKTAMDVRIGLPNEHLAGSARNEINQPMYATAVGLIMRGFEFLETYKITFDICPFEELETRSKAAVRPPVVQAEPQAVSDEKAVLKEEPVSTEPPQQEVRITFVDKLKTLFTTMLEASDQPITIEDNSRKNK